MKRVTNLLFAVVLSAFVFSVSAQGDDLNLSGASEKSKYGDNWFISVGGSANLLTAEEDKNQTVLNRAKLGGEFTLGKWFNSDFGMRIQAMGGGLRGFNYQQSQGGIYLDGDHGQWFFPMGMDDNRYIPKLVGMEPVDVNRDWSKFNRTNDKAGIGPGFWQEFNYVSASVDFMANLSNLFRGHYKENSRFDVVAFAGLGVIHAFGNDLTTPDFNYVVGKTGFRTNLNLSPKWALYLEPQLNITSPEFDGYKGDAMVDGIVNLSFGIQYTFNRDFTSSNDFLSLEEINYLNDKINENRSLIENHQDILERQQRLLNDLEKCCDENEVITKVVERQTLPEYVRFVLDSDEIEQSEYAKIVDVVQYLKVSPDSKLLLVGYADKNTGNPSYNMDLSQRRVQAVTNELNRLGISQNRLVVEWKGDKVQPFAPNDWNRVVVMVERK